MDFEEANEEKIPLEKYPIETSETGEEAPEVPKDEILDEEKPKFDSYEMRMWAGKIPIYVCSFCGRQYDDEDRAIMHVLGHYPQGKREKVLDKLVKDKKHGK